MSFGEELRRERELRQITLREISQATKINMRFLEALERNDFTFLPGGVFNRGYVRGYCKHIGIDSEAMVNAYLLEERGQLGEEARDDGLLRGRRAAPPEEQAPERGRSRRLIRWGLVVAGAILLAAAAYFVYSRLTGAAPHASDTPARSASAASVGPAAPIGTEQRSS